MKALIAALITLVFLFTAPAFAGKSGGAGKGSHKRVKDSFSNEFPQQGDANYE